MRTPPQPRWLLLLKVLVLELGTSSAQGPAMVELTNGLSRPVGHDVWPPRDVRIVQNWNSTTLGNDAVLRELVEPKVPPYLVGRSGGGGSGGGGGGGWAQIPGRPGAVRVVAGQRQLFVDDFLVQHTQMPRRYFRPRPENDGRPVMPPVPLSHDPPNVPYPGGLHNCPASDRSGGAGAREFRLYWHEYKKDRVELATSKDLVTWTRRASTRVAAGTSTPRVPCLGLNDAWTFMTPDADGSCSTMYAFAKSCPRLGPGVVFQLASNGTVWERVAETGKTHDRGSFWWNPFSRSWAFNVRLDFSGYARSLWYWEAPHPLRSEALEWLVPEKWRGKFSPKDWRLELERDWAQAALAAPGGADQNDRSPSGPPGRAAIPSGMPPGVRLPVPFIAPDARDQRETPNYNNDLVALEGDCTPRTCGATHRSACVSYRVKYLKWYDAYHASKSNPTTPPPPPPPKELLPSKCVRLTDVYAMEAVPYESVLVGLFAIWQGGQTGELKHMQVWAGFTRDGFHFHRPSMPLSTLATGPSASNGLKRFAGRDADPSARGLEQGAFLRYPGAGWRNVQPVANGIQNLRDRAFVMYTARHQKSRKSAVFLSSMRRDGFAAMRCGVGGGGAGDGGEEDDGDGGAGGGGGDAQGSTLCTLTTVPLVVSGLGGSSSTNVKLHVNADASRGRLVVAVLPAQQTAPVMGFPELSAEKCAGLQDADSTDAVIRWTGDDAVGSLATALRSGGGDGGSAVQLKFVATGNVDLYSFWFS